MATMLKDSVIHWKKKLDKNPDEDIILNVIRKLSKVPITIEILQETHIGKCIRKLSKRHDIVGEKALAVLNKWRTVFASVDAAADKKPKHAYVKENLNKKRGESRESSTSSKHDASYDSIHHQKETSHHAHKHHKNSSHSSKKYINGDCNINSDESSPSLYTYEKKEASSKYIYYDPHSEVSEGYNPECPDLFPDDKSMKKKTESHSLDIYEPSSLKRKLEEQQTDSVCILNNSKKLKSESHFSLHASECKDEKKEKHNKAKVHSSSNLKKELRDKMKQNISKHPHKLSSDAKKSKNKESNENNAKAKLKMNWAEEFTSSEVRFEDCLGFNDMVIKKKKNVKPSQSAPKKPVVTKSRPTSTHQEEKVPKENHVQKGKLHVNIPKPKEFSKLEEVDIMSTLPAIQPNYKPLPQKRSLDSFSSKKKEVLTNEEAILFMSSKKEKTAVYSGRRSYLTEVPSLFEFCTRVLIENIDAIEYMGEVPYFLLKPVLEKCTPTQLYSIENFNHHLLESTHELWEIHCKRDYKFLSPEENETWRELYLRAHEERERKLKSITANISASMSKSNPVRQVKLAYVDSVAKPPRDVARRQAKNGTALPVNHPVKAGPASKASPRPVAPVVNAAASSSASASYAPKKPKVAPLMAKTLKSMKQCFRRK